MGDTKKVPFDGYEIGQRIAELRKEHDMLQKDMPSVFGMSEATKAEQISMFEIGTKKLKPEYILNVAQYFGVSTDYLFGLTESKSLDATHQATVNYTGLSDTAIENLVHPPHYVELSRGEEHYLKTILNDFLSSDYFCELNSELMELKEITSLIKGFSRSTEEERKNELERMPEVTGADIEKLVYDVNGTTTTDYDTYVRLQLMDYRDKLDLAQLRTERALRHIIDDMFDIENVNKRLVFFDEEEQ